MLTRAPCLIEKEREGARAWARAGQGERAGLFGKRGKVEQAGSPGLTVGLGFGFLFLWVFSSFLFQTSLY